MFKSVKEFDDAVYTILEAVNNSIDIFSFEEKYSKEQFSDLMEYICNHHLVNGLNMGVKNLAGIVSIQTVGTVRLTRSGLDFVESRKD